MSRLFRTAQEIDAAPEEVFPFFANDVERIFAYRREVLATEFEGAGVDPGRPMPDFGSHERR